MSLTVALRLAFQGKDAQTGVRATATEVKGLTAATKEAGAASTAAAGQQRQMTGALAETGAAARGAAAAQVTAAQTARDMAQSNRMAAGSVGNLTANFNDIGMMIAAGQNPLQLAIQQGTQITQVIGPMGAAGAVGALKAAFLQLLNPLNLGTLAIIALGAAAIQWLTGASEKAMTFDDALTDLQAQIKAYDDAAKKARASTADLRKEFGEGAEAARVYYERLAEAELREAERKARETAAALKEQVAPTTFLQSDQKNAADLFGLSIWSREQSAVVNEVLAALDAVDRAKGIDNQVAALERLEAAMQAAAAADGQINATENAAILGINQLLIEQIGLRERIAQANGESSGSVVDLEALVQMQAELTAARAEDAALAQQMIADLNSEAQIRQLITQYGSDSVIVATERARIERLNYAAMVDSMNVSAALKAELMSAYDAAKGIAGVNIAGMLEVAIGKAAALANNLWNAANASSAIRPMMNVGSNVASGVRGWATGIWNNMVTMATSGAAGGVGAGVGSGASGGGAAAARDEADAVAELIAQKERELELQRETDPVKKEMLRLSEQLAGATDEERRQIEELIRTREREREQLDARSDAIKYANDMTLNLLNTVIVQGKSANAVLQQLLGSLAQAFITGGGPLAGILGIRGGIWDMILPSRAAGGAAMAAAGKAMGGSVMGGTAMAAAGKPVINVHVNGATGNQEVRSMVAQGVQTGLRIFSTDVLPREIRQANADPQVVRK